VLRITVGIDGMIRIWVEDNGIGIAPEHQDNGLFQQLHNQETIQRSVGLALVARGGRMGSKAGVELKAGEGSRFWVDHRAEAKPDRRCVC
jgi:signal transduction histidine kinase